MPVEHSKKVDFFEWASIMSFRKKELIVGEHRSQMFGVIPISKILEKNDNDDDNNNNNDYGYDYDNEDDNGHDNDTFFKATWLS